MTTMGLRWAQNLSLIATMRSNFRTKVTHCSMRKFKTEQKEASHAHHALSHAHTHSHQHGTTCNNNRRRHNNERKTYFEWELRPEVPFVHERRNRYSTCSLKFFHHRCLLLQLCTKFRISPVPKKTLLLTHAHTLSRTLSHSLTHTLTEKMIRSGWQIFRFTSQFFSAFNDDVGFSLSFFVSTIFAALILTSNWLER